MELWNVHLLILFFFDVSRSECFSTVCMWPSPDVWRELQSCKCESSLWCLVLVCDMIAENYSLTVEEPLSKSDDSYT